MESNLTQEEVLRYSRHLMIPEVGLEGQEKLKSASVLIVGLGGFGCYRFHCIWQPQGLEDWGWSILMWLIHQIYNDKLCTQKIRSVS